MCWRCLAVLFPLLHYRAWLNGSCADNASRAAGGVWAAVRRLRALICASAAAPAAAGADDTRGTEFDDAGWGAGGRADRSHEKRRRAVAASSATLVLRVNTSQLGRLQSSGLGSAFYAKMNFADDFYADVRIAVGEGNAWGIAHYVNTRLCAVGMHDGCDVCFGEFRADPLVYGETGAGSGWGAAREGEVGTFAVETERPKWKRNLR
jgi:hypothetical protein